MNADEARAYLLGAEKGAQVFAHVVAGLNAGLFEAIARHGEEGVRPEVLARELGYFEDYVRVWCETAYAWRLLDDAGEGHFRVVSLCSVMHEIRADIRPQAVCNLWQALRPGGILVSIDQYYPSRLEDFREDEYYIAVMDQAAEVVWGNRHLPREGLAELFAASGFLRTEFHVIQLPGQPSPRLVALAFR